MAEGFWESRSRDQLLGAGQFALSGLDSYTRASLAAGGADTLRENAKIAMENAKYDAERFDAYVNQTMASQKAALAAQGMDVGGSTALDFMAYQTMEASIQRRNIMRAGEQTAASYRAAARDADKQASWARTQGNLQMGLSLASLMLG